MFLFRRLPQLALLWLAAAAALGLGLACSPPAGSAVRSAATATATEAVDDGTLEVLFTYGSEKEEWVKAVTQTFNDGKATTKSGKVIRVKAVPLGSGESIEEVLADPPVRQPHLISPASGMYVELGNAWSKKAKQGPLFGPTKKLLRSPVVVAMWKEMAEAMGWPKKELGWKDLHDLITADKGWGKFDQADWGRFRYGHTHPQYSNSGLAAALAEVYSAVGKTEGLTAEDAKKAGPFLERLERAVVHYGSSTGFFGRRMFANDPLYLNAAVLYENMVVEANLPKNKAKMKGEVVALYPREGTVWSDHPVGVVQRKWVTAEHKEAAQKYIDYLMEEKQQEKAVELGFRPGLERVKLRSPLDRKHGVDPDNEPKTTLEVPPADVLEAVLEAWKKHKKGSRVVLVIDTSGSMNDDNKLRSAKAGARKLIEMLGERDSLSLVVFNSTITWMEKDLTMDAAGRARVDKRVANLLARGQTALYDAVGQAFDAVDGKPSDRINAVVVLTDGMDNKSKLTLKELTKKIAFDAEKRPTRVFTICYGSSAAAPTQEERDLRKVLEAIAESTRAKAYLGDPKNIRGVFIDIATFF